VNGAGKNPGNGPLKSLIAGELHPISKITGCLSARLSNYKLLFTNMLKLELGMILICLKLEMEV